MVCIFKKEDGSMCGSKFNLKEVEFRHPSYEDLSTRVFLCEEHFNRIFGRPIITQEHFLPLEQQEYLKRKYFNAREKYHKDLSELIKKVKEGVGLEFFDLDSWKFTNHLKVEQAKERYLRYIKKVCRFEYCDNSLTNIKIPYIIRVYPKTPRDYVNLFFCCLDHWEVYKKRIGFKTLTGKLDPNKKIVDNSLESYMELKKTDG